MAEDHWSDVVCHLQSWKDKFSKMELINHFNHSSLYFLSIVSSIVKKPPAQALSLFLKHGYH